MFLHNKIRIARQKEKLSVERLALHMALAGYIVCRQTLANWENGKSKPDVDGLVSLCKALNKPLGYFFDQKHNKDSYVTISQ